MIQLIKNKRKKITTIFTFLIFFNTSPVFAQENFGFTFPRVYEYEENQLVLRGVGLKKILFVKKAFVAGLYLDEDIATEDVFEDVPKRIDVSYFIHISGEKLTNYTESLMKKNMTKQEYGLLKERIVEMRKYFVDLEPGDHFSLTYIPRTGTKFEHNGQLIGVIEGQDFAKGLFATWIGERPMDEKIKSQILGLAVNSVKGGYGTPRPYPLRSSGVGG